jgi:hypothetical protein
VPAGHILDLERYGIRIALGGGARLSLMCAASAHEVNSDWR